MTSRLDRLFILLESGSSAVTRRAAAKQIGEVQRLYPHELHHLLNRLIGYLHSNTWDTRIAAAQAIEAILNNVPKWNPIFHQIKNENSSIDHKSHINPATMLSFQEFNLTEILQKGARLMGSEGTEFDVQEEDSVNNSNERLIHQRKILHEKLGIAQGNKLGIIINEMITDDDMRTEKHYNINEQKVPVQEILNLKPIPTYQGNGQTGMSCRELNRARRKARQNISSSSASILIRSNSSSNGNGTNNSCSSSSSTSGGSSINLDEPEIKKPKIEADLKYEIFYNLNSPVPEPTGTWSPETTSWPLEQLCLILYLDLFNPKWEIRHGAATALRELLNTHSAGAGKSITMTTEEMETHHNLWLEDSALRFLCVLSLDRFGDFVSDQVVAPVRETCAQVLGTLLKEIQIEKVQETINVLLKLIKQKEWEIRHGGLLGLKYLLVVREDLLPTLLPIIINDVLLALLDQVDDVGAVAASTLIPVAAWLPKLLNNNQVSSIVQMLWDLLLNQDELTSACNSFMGLLAAILCLPDASNWIQMEPMSVLIPRLWPFLSHSTSSVRKSTLQTLKTLTDNNLNSPINNEKTAATTTRPSIYEQNKLLKLNFGVKDWGAPLLQEALRHIYQRVLVEPNQDIQELSIQVWMNLINNAELSALLHAACPYVSSWICLAMQPQRLAFDPALLIFAKPLQGNRERRRTGDDLGGNIVIQQKYYLGGNESTPQDLREKNFIKARVNAAKILGQLSIYLVKPAPGVIYTPDVESPIDCYTKVLMGHLQSRSAVQRLVCGMIISYWTRADPSICPGPQQLQDKLLSCVMENVYYDEVALSFTRLLQEANDFIATLKQHLITIPELDPTKVLTLDQINQLSTTLTENIRRQFLLKSKVYETFDDRRKSLQNTYKQTTSEQNSLNLSTQAALAGAIIYMKCLPKKLNPVIKPLMESIKREECEILQQLSAEYLVELLDQVIDRTPNPNNKIITNLSALLKSDHNTTPKIIFPQKDIDQYSSYEINPFYGILSLTNQQKTVNELAITSRGPGRPPVNIDVTMDDIFVSNDSNNKFNQIQRIGATFAITEICKHFGANLYEKVPAISLVMFETINRILKATPCMLELTKNAISIDQNDTNDLVTSLQLSEIAVPNIHQSIHNEIFNLLPQYGILLTHPLKGIRSMVARCLATIATIDDCKIMNFVVDKIIPLLETSDNIIYRQGAAESIDRIVNKLQFRMVPYVVLLVVPLLGRMSDPDESVRLISTHCFATLIQLMPLDMHTPTTTASTSTTTASTTTTTASTTSTNANNNNEQSSSTTSMNNSNLSASKELQARKTRDRQFLEYLFAPKTIPDFKVPIDIKAELRSYQQAGVNWLWFLNKYNLHGILCDDMGLGKTLQALCVLTADHHYRISQKLSDLPSIVICPPTLTGHWLYEILKFVPTHFLQPLHYVGLPIEREKIRTKVGTYNNLVVASYDTVRKDVEFFKSISWNYCVLDEGHIIKNGKTKCSKAIKQMKANHRLILSGTPIQNNVLELWSLFDFLMPGFLGTEKQFMVRYSRPILVSRDAKSSPKEQEAGVLAMEALHRQVLPFLLRRVKEDVLTDLPPKITQDLLCELSPLQERLYEDFSKNHLNSEIKDCIEKFGNAESLNKKTHIFQALRYLQNVCNHPKLVLTPNHPEYEKITQELNQSKLPLDDIEHSAKLPALKQLLLDCGIGIENETVSQHRALIFCQLKTMLDIIEKDLLKKHMPNVSYLRLDGSIQPSYRQDIVANFNGDPSIDVLLLTTQVGGLGLNLTGADTVIFVEHDWNPMKDLQAMDRAHRIGQKRVVNVYRLITRKSLEEKIMGLQKFKILTVNTIVGADNASMETMGTDKLLDLFNLSNDDKSSPQSSSSSAAARGQSTSSAAKDGKNLTFKQITENLPELWEDRQYEEEYDLTQFLKSLKK